MNRIINATDARIHFGDVIRRAKTGPVIVERAGKPAVVVISKQEYDRLVEAAPKQDWWEKLEKAQALIRKELKSRKLPDPAEMLQLARKERDEEILDSLRRR